MVRESSGGEVQDWLRLIYIQSPIREGLDTDGTEARAPQRTVRSLNPGNRPSNYTYKIVCSISPSSWNSINGGDESPPRRLHDNEACMCAGPASGGDAQRSRGPSETLPCGSQLEKGIWHFA